MKAAILNSAGGVENFSIADIPKPVIKPNEVLVQVKAISINPVDIKTRKGGSFYEELKKDPYTIIGWDISGIVAEVGNEVTKFKKGDEVFGMVNFPGKGKAYAEYVASPEDHLAIKPSNIDHFSAAASTLAALTAWQALVQQIKLQKGEKILIHAAAGGVGHFAVQIAKHLGAYVIGTSSAGNIDFIKSLGAYETINYNEQAFEEVVKDADAVLDAVGGDVGIRSLKAVKKGGRVLTILPGTAAALKKESENYDLQAWAYLVKSSGEDMQQLAQLLQQGIIKPFISHQYKLEEIAEAHRQSETGRTRGKIVVTI